MARQTIPGSCPRPGGPGPPAPRSRARSTGRTAAPGRLRPAGVGDRPVQVAGAQVVPEARRSDVPEPVGRPRAGPSSGSATVPLVKNRSIGSSRRRRDRRGGLAVAGGVEQRVEVLPAAGARPSAQAMRWRRLLGSDASIASTFSAPSSSRDRRTASPLPQAVGDVARGQDVRGRHRDGSDPDGAEDRRVPRRNARQHHEHRVALAGAQLAAAPARLGGTPGRAPRSTGAQPRRRRRRATGARGRPAPRRPTARRCRAPG